MTRKIRSVSVSCRTLRRSPEFFEGCQVVVCEASSCWCEKQEVICVFFFSFLFSAGLLVRRTRNIMTNTIVALDSFAGTTSTTPSGEGVGAGGSHVKRSRIVCRKILNKPLKERNLGNLTLEFYWPPPPPPLHKKSHWNARLMLIHRVF